MAKAKLAEYKRKRDPKKTPEPFGGKKRGKKPIFVVQRHDARRLHYDFRLERNGALASWAVPKGVAARARAAASRRPRRGPPARVRDLRGRDPEGPVRRRHRSRSGTTARTSSLEEKKDGGLTVRLHGKRLEGTYALVPAKLSGDPKNWLILRKKDESAPAPRKPRKYAAMFATLADKVPKGGDWLYEIKWDGYRIVATVAGGEPELRTRKDQDYTQAVRERGQGAREGAQDP